MARLCSLLTPVLAILWVLGPAGAARAQSCQGWTQRTPPTSPSGRYEYGMAYDSARHEAVLFGGGYPELGDTWAWDGTNWTLRAKTGPSPRELHAMAYDSARGVTVLFGGSPSPLELSRETWEWDGSTWTLRATGGPVARSGHAMAYDSARGVTVLFGGHDKLYYDGDTWEWDGTSWSRRAVASPSARWLSGMAYDSARGVTVLFGGVTYDYSADQYVHFNDTWEWDGVTWRLRSNGGPSPRDSLAFAYDSARGVTVLHGGFYQLGDTWEWDGESWVQRADAPPSKRANHVMVYDSARQVSVLFGGWKGAGSYLNDTWEWEGGGAATWTNYGAGWPGTSGVPSLTTPSNPVLCAPITVDLGNSLGVSTLTALFLGLSPSDRPTNYDGHFLVAPSNILLLTLPGAGLAIPGTVPCNPVLCGRSIYLQALEVDPGASQGVSFTQGLRLVLGS
jgi:hypothetical protein